MRWSQFVLWVVGAIAGIAFLLFMLGWLIEIVGDTKEGIQRDPRGCVLTLLGMVAFALVIAACLNESAQPN